LKSNQKLSRAIITVLGAHAAAVYADLPGNAPSTANEIGEITVTAQRRSESAQNVPIALQVLTGEVLQQLNVTTLEDYVKYLPNVVSAGAGPGQNNIYMRGLSTGSGLLVGSGGVGSFPNVAVYLDEQSAQLPSRNLDIYAADLERIEVLEGPQGTLFGAGAQAGVVRYITNKPKIDVTEGDVNAGYAVTAHGEPSTNVDAMINIPVLENALALRGVIYNESRGGYINNIPGTFSRATSDRGVVNYFSGVVPPNSGPINNSANVGNAINPVVYQGLRVSGNWKIDDDWNALITQSYQSMKSDGVFWEEQYDGLGKSLPPLSVQLFNPLSNRDKFEDTQLTITGRIRDLKLLYTGGYLDRNVTQVQDYTNYSRGTYASYYQCLYPGYPFVYSSTTKSINPTTNSPGNCYSPSEFWVDHQNSTHQSHELRLSTPDEWRARAIGGVFWEDYTIHEQADWYYGNNTALVPVAPPPGASSNNPNVRPLGDTFFDDITRGYKQTAAFGSFDFDLIPKKLTLRLGTRYYRIQNFEAGSNIGSFYCEIDGPYTGIVPKSPCTVPQSFGSNLNARNLHNTYTGFRSLANVTWHVTDDAMVYYTWSQGFRPGGFNRAVGQILQGSPLYGIYKPPLAYAPDTLINNELGWKTEWLDHRIQWNGAAYQEDWRNTQINIFDPGVTGSLAFTTNGPNYRVRGVETSLITRITTGLTLTGSAAWNHSAVVKTLSLIDPTTNEPIPIENPFGALGSPLAQSPPFMGNIRVRDEIPINGYKTFWQVAANHTGGSYATTDQISKTLQGASVAFYDPGFTTYDASLGISQNAWTAEFYGANITDTRGILFASYTEWVKANTINRPRTVGLRFSYKFMENK
jgi:outer membrane receptor protein involved in Fe transport